MSLPDHPASFDLDTPASAGRATRHERARWGRLGRGASARQRFAGAAALVGASAMLLSGCLAAASTIKGREAKPLMSVANSTRTVHLHLLAADPGAPSQFNFDGASNGKMTITVPLGWTVKATCTNFSTVLTHSCAIVDPNTKTLAFADSAVPHPVQGLRPGKGAEFTFVASRPGTYELVCLVPGHRGLGMWDHFVVRAGAKPSITGAGA